MSFVKSLIEDKVTAKIIRTARKAKIGEKCTNYADAILVHGPISEQMHVESIKTMRAIYRGNYILCATWRGERLADEIVPYVDAILFEDEPQYSPLHINHQLRLMKRGLEKILEVQRKNGIMEGFAMKCRSDQVFFNKKIFSEYRMTPDILCGKSELYGLSKKLLVYDIAKYMLYRVSDFTMVGTTRDMLHYWSQPLMLESSGASHAETIESAARGKCAPETFFVQNFCEYVGKDLDYTFADSWDVYRSVFVLWNRRRFKMVWAKHPNAWMGQTWLYRTINCRVLYKIIGEREYHRAVQLEAAKYATRIGYDTNPNKRIFVMRETWHWENKK